MVRAQWNNANKCMYMYCIYAYANQAGRSTRRSPHAVNEVSSGGAKSAIRAESQWILCYLVGFVFCFHFVCFFFITAVVGYLLAIIVCTMRTPSHHRQSVHKCTHFKCVATKEKTTRNTTHKRTASTEHAPGAISVLFWWRQVSWMTLFSFELVHELISSDDDFGWHRQPILWNAAL